MMNIWRSLTTALGKAGWRSCIIQPQLYNEHKLQACIVLNELNSQKVIWRPLLTPLIPPLHFYSKPRLPVILLI